MRPVSEGKRKRYTLRIVPDYQCHRNVIWLRLAKTQWWSLHSRKESIPNCLLMKGQRFKRCYDLSPNASLPSIQVCLINMFANYDEHAPTVQRVSARMVRQALMRSPWLANFHKTNLHKVKDRCALYIQKCELNFLANLKRVKILAPKPTIGVNENHNVAVCLNWALLRGRMRNNNGSLFEMPLTCQETLKYRKVN